MGLFSKKKVENAIQVNDVNKNALFACGWDGLWTPYKKGFKPFGKIYLQMALNTIYDGVSNVTIESQKYSDNITVKDICNFVDKNSTLLVSQWINLGFMCVFYNNDMDFWIPKNTDLKYDQYRRVINRNAVVVYSPLYQTDKVSYMQVVMPLLGLLDKLGNTTNETTNTMGVLPIISGNSIPANPKFKEDLANAMTKNYGWNEDQMRYMLSQAELKVDKIDLQIKDLELRENLLDAFKYLLNYFGVPIDLVIGNSTYANMETARLFFYETTIRKYAEAMLRMAQAMLLETPMLIPKSAINYKLNNVKGLETTLSDKCKERNAYIDTLLKLANAGMDVSLELEKVLEDVKKDYLEV